MADQIDTSRWSGIDARLSGDAARFDAGRPLEDDERPMTPLGAYADEVRRGGKAEQNEFREMTDAERAAIPALDFKAWGCRDLAAIPFPEFIYSDFYARGYTSVTLAPPKVGKSMLGLAEAIDIASGRGILTGARRDRHRVLYYNAEDDQAVIDSRVAAVLCHYGIEQSEIEDTLFPVSGVEAEGFYLVTGQDGTVNEQLFTSLEKFIEANAIDATIFDPLQDLSRSPETNDVFRILGQRLRRMASMMRTAVGLIHHTRKIAPGAIATIEDGRGGSALRGTARFNRLLLSMTEDEAVKAGVDNHRHYLRIGDMESNLAPPSADVNRWFRKVSISIPNGHQAGAIVPWRWPDAFDGVSRETASMIRRSIAAMSDPPRENPRSSAWVGHLIASTLGIDTDDKAVRSRVSTMIRTWVANGVLEVSEVRSPRDGRDIKVILAGPNDPASEGDS